MARSHESIWQTLSVVLAGFGGALLTISVAVGLATKGYSIWTSTPALVAYVMAVLAFACIACAFYDAPIPLPRRRQDAEPQTHRDPQQELTQPTQPLAESETQIPALKAEAAERMAELSLAPRHAKPPSSHDTEAAPVSWPADLPAPRKLYRRVRVRPIRALEDAERLAQSFLNKESRASALAAIAGVLADSDPDRAVQVLADALTDVTPGPWMSTKVLEVVATSDPAEAERLAQAIACQEGASFRLDGVVGAMAASDPDRAERIAWSIRHDLARLRALKAIVEALAVYDPDRAWRVARSIPHAWYRAEALQKLAVNVAAFDPARAGLIASSIGKANLKASALAEVARTVTCSDPDLAVKLITSAESAYELMKDRWWTSLGQKERKAVVSTEIAGALIKLDPARSARFVANAECIARSVHGKARRVRVLVAIASALAGFDPAQSVRLLTDAAHIAQSIAWWRGPFYAPQLGGPVPWSTREAAITEVASAAASVAPELAERLAPSIASTGCEGIAKAMADYDPDRAERVARPGLGSPSDDNARGAARALGKVAEVVAASDPDRAVRIAWSITSPGYDFSGIIVMALANVAQVVAAADPDRAERIVWSITSLHHDFSRDKDMALANVAQVVAAADPDRAERIIWSITDDEIRVKALVAIARLCLESEEFFERSERLNNV